MELSIQLGQKGLTQFTHSTSKTDSLEIILRIFHKTIRFFSLLLKKGETACSLQLEKSIEVLGVVQGIHLIQEFTCPDEKGLYLFQKASLEKCAGRCFLFGYNCLLNLKLADKLELIRLPEIARIAIGHCSLLRLATDVSYLFYRILAVIEGIKKRNPWQTAISTSKIFTTSSALILSFLGMRITVFALALTSIAILTDSCNLAKKERWI